MSFYLKFSGILALVIVGNSTNLRAAQDHKKIDPPGPQPVNVFNPVVGRAKVLSCKPEGALVKKGEMVCELDPTPLKDQATNQVIVIAGAQAA